MQSFRLITVTHVLFFVLCEEDPSACTVVSRSDKRRSWEDDLRKQEHTKQAEQTEQSRQHVRCYAWTCGAVWTSVSARKRNDKLFGQKSAHAQHNIKPKSASFARKTEAQRKRNESKWFPDQAGSVPKIRVKLLCWTPFRIKLSPSQGKCPFRSGPKTRFCRFQGLITSQTVCMVLVYGCLHKKSHTTLNHVGAGLLDQRPLCQHRD